MYVYVYVQAMGVVPMCKTQAPTFLEPPLISTTFGWVVELFADHSGLTIIPGVVTYDTPLVTTAQFYHTTVVRGTASQTYITSSAARWICEDTHTRRVMLEQALIPRSCERAFPFHVDWVQRCIYQTRQNTHRGPSLLQ